MSAPITTKPTPCAPRSQRFGCGVDVVELARFRRAVKRSGQAFLKRVYTDLELETAKRRRDREGYLAGRFAAKEAVVKAVAQVDPDHPLTMRQIEVRNDALGRPYVVLRRRAHAPRAVYVSLSHADHTAVASAIAIR